MLTTTQHSAYGDLHRFGYLTPSRTAWAPDGSRAYSRRTLQALVSAGLAQWDTREIETAPGLSHTYLVVVPS